MQAGELCLVHNEQVGEMLDGGEVEGGEGLARPGVGRWGETDVHMHAGMVGDESPMTGG